MTTRLVMSPPGWDATQAYVDGLGRSDILATPGPVSLTGTAAICKWPKSATACKTEALSRYLLGKRTRVELRKAVSWITTVMHDRVSDLTRQVPGAVSYQTRMRELVSELTVRGPRTSENMSDMDDHRRISTSPVAVYW
jgi:hypothetical protein